MRAPHSPPADGRGLSWPRRLLVAGCFATAATFACQPLASAHVEVSPNTVQPGAPALLSFHVPNERDDATTVRFELDFPADRPLASVTPQAVPGWKITVQRQAATTAPSGEMAGDDDEMAEGPVSSIVWEGGTIGMGTFGDFPVRIADLLGSGTIAFTAVQTYSSGETVRWADPMQPGQPEPELPAPTLTVEPLAAATPAESTSDTLARVLGGAGLVAGAAAVVVAFTRRRPGGRAPEPATTEAGTTAGPEAEAAGQRETSRL